MATRNDGRRRLAAVARNARADVRRGPETTLRDQIEEAIDEAETTSRSSRRPQPARAADAAQPAALRRPHRRRGRVTRGDIIAVPATISFDELVAAFAEAGHSRLPVYGESLDEVIGMIHIKDVFKAQVRSVATALDRGR